tara:strand:+ start:126 stop:995 length:870 start_codon:yes stop_codon:yes gene_type:complete
VQSIKIPSNFYVLAQRRGIPVEHIPGYYEAVLNICQAAVSCFDGSMLTLGIGGGQGTGKSTISFMVKNVLAQVFSISAEILSIDDYYLTRDERFDLAAKVHPLLAVRGVPGTHDMHWMRETISSLRSGESCKVPVFSKGEDDRLHYEQVKYPPEILILEGWCWGARHVPDEELQCPINELEAQRDSDLVWRRFVNQALASDIYQECFATDLQVFLNAPNMEAIFRWRFQQESQLINGGHIMSQAEIRNFIMHYQRISDRMQKQSAADISVLLGDDHEVVQIDNRFITKR